MPYRGNPTTDVNDQVRLLIGDTSTSTGNEIFTDGEIDYFVAQKPNAFLAASLAVKQSIGSSRAESIAGVVRKQVGDLVLQSGGGESVSQILTNKAKELRAEGVRKVKPYAGGISHADKDAAEKDTDRVAPNFSIGMHDHPGIGSNTTSTGGWF